MLSAVVMKDSVSENSKADASMSCGSDQTLDRGPMTRDSRSPTTIASRYAGMGTDCVKLAPSAVSYRGLETTPYIQFHKVW